LSLLEHEAQQQRERQAAARNTASNADAVPSRESSNVSPDPASQLSHDELPHSTQAAELDSSLTISVTNPSSGASTPLHANSSRVSAPVSDNSSEASKDARGETAESSTSPMHRRTGSAPIHVASSSLNGAAALAMAVGFPSPSPESGTPSEPAEMGQPGLPPRTLNTLSVAVGASTIPAAILGMSANDRSVIKVDSADNLATSQESVGAGQADVPSTSDMAPSVKHQVEGSPAALTSSPPLGGYRVGDTVQLPNEPLTAPRSPALVAAPVPKPTSNSISSLPNPFDSPAVKFTVDDMSVNSPVTSQNPDVGNQPSAAFLTPAARTVTDSSVLTTDSQQSKGDSYNVLLSSPETETDEPLMSGPPNLARLDTADSYSAQAGTSGSSAH
jgi:hypothetical protein